MIRRAFHAAAILLAVVSASTSRADSEYWVSVGSYRTYEEAESAREQAGRRLPESFSIAEAELDSGLWYRVLAGPYLTQEIADHMLAEARRQGFDTPWVLVTDTLLAGPMTGYADSLLAAEPAFTEEGDTERYDVDLPSEPPMDIPGFNAPVRTDPEKDHKVVGEAPAGYGLNRLRRN
ncbi:MAG: SPOR domain-containing protein [Pseudomonadales bacterium]